MKEEEPSRAKRNWAKVRNIMLSKNLSHKQKDKKFTLFKKQMRVEEGTLITTYNYEDFHFIQATPQPLYKELTHFKSEIDATGKWVWEAEEIASYFLIRNAAKYLPKISNQDQLKKRQTFRILQLGAGCSGLAAITLAKVFQSRQILLPLEVLITDGQEENISFLIRNLELNNSLNSKASLMRWGDEEAQLNLTSQSSTRLSFSIIIICDCLYFTQFHKQLLLTIDSYLSQEGVVLLVNPQRGDSMMQFLSLASSLQFQSTFVDFNDEKYQSQLDRIKANPAFNPDKDAPFFIELSRKGSQS